MYAVPSLLAKPTGPEYVDLFTATAKQYSTTGSVTASSYEWRLTPPEAGTLTVSESGLDCTVDWLATFTGQAELKVKGFNNCGEGDYSELLDINVANTFGIAENESGLNIVVFPNPGNGKFQVDLTSDKSIKTVIKLLTPFGEPVWGPVEVGINRKLTLPIHVPALADGIYLLQFETNKGISYRKIIIKK